MTGRRDRKLSDEERVLWNVIARTTMPLKGKRAMEIPEVPPVEAPKVEAMPAKIAVEQK